MPHMASTPVRRRAGSALSLIVLAAALTVGMPLIASADDGSSEQLTPSSSVVAPPSTDVAPSGNDEASTPEETAEVAPAPAEVGSTPPATEPAPTVTETQGAVGVYLITELEEVPDAFARYRVIATNSETREDSEFYAIGGGQGVGATLQLYYWLDVAKGTTLTVRSERGDGKSLYYDGSPTGTFDASKALALTVDSVERVEITLKWPDAQEDPSVQPTPPTAESLTETTKGGVGVPDNGTVGNTVSVYVGIDRAGSSVNGWLFDAPTYLGASTVDPSGNVVFTIPDGVSLGAHRLAITDAQNTLIGWGNILIGTAAVTDSSAADQTNAKTLAATGTELPIGVVGAATLMLLAGSALIVARSRSRRA